MPRPPPGRTPAPPPSLLPTGWGVNLGWLDGGPREVATLGAAWWIDYEGINTPPERDGPGHAYMTWGDDPAVLSAWAAAHPGHAWILGNEPNVAGQERCGPVAACAARYRAQGAAIRAGDPTAALIGPGLGNADLAWAAQLVAAGGDVFGGWNIHSYSSARAPYDPALLIAQVQAFQAWLARRQDARPLIVGEWGLHPQATDPAGAATYVQMAGSALAKSGVRAWAWFGARSAGRWAGDLLTPDGTLTKAGVAFRSAAAPVRRTR